VDWATPTVDGQRELEIESWLQAHPGTHQHAILDDGADAKRLAPHLVQPDSDIGLRLEDIIEVCAIFGLPFEPLFLDAGLKPTPEDHAIYHAKQNQKTMRMKTLSEFNFNGESALIAALACTPYKALEQAIASLTLFTDPKIVEVTKNKALFRIRKFGINEHRGQIVEPEKVVLCDNQSPTLAFLWANNLQKSQLREVQFNHIYPLSQNRNFFTSLANICVTPAFLAKLTDKNPTIINLLRYRAWRIYQNFLPKGFEKPKRPKAYSDLEWAEYPFISGCADRNQVKKELRWRINERIAKSPQSRIGKSARHFGWLLSPKPKKQ